VIRVNLLCTSWPQWPILRQTPAGRGIWDDCQFFVGEEAAEFDFCVVYDSLPRPVMIRCPRDNTIFVTGEPPSVKTYDPHFLNQFGTIVTCHRSIDHPRVIRTQQALPWLIGAKCDGHVLYDKRLTKDYDELKTIKSFKKTKLISVICSQKAFTAGHKRRLSFVKQVSRRIPEIDVFGQGFRAIEDKWDGIADYRYHIALENCVYPNYWTEKLSDAFLAGAYPFYYGCPNLSDYFPTGSYTPIDIRDTDACVSAIEQAIAGSLYERSVNEILLARELVLDKHNLFALLSGLCKEHNPHRPKETVLLKPESMFFSSRQGIFSWALSKLRYSTSYLRNGWHP
jgi:hypothetical protein